MQNEAVMEEHRIDIELFNYYQRTVEDLKAGNKQKPFTRKYKTGRNEPCPCNSGKKFKKCCIDKIR
jgi:uncharacterized protein YecA (UPF0149 family)